MPGREARHQWGCPGLAPCSPPGSPPGVRPSVPKETVGHGPRTPPPLQWPTAVCAGLSCVLQAQSSLLGLCPPDVISSPFPQLVVAKMSPDTAKCPWVAGLPQLRPSDVEHRWKYVMHSSHQLNTCLKIPSGLCLVLDKAWFRLQFPTCPLACPYWPCPEAERRRGACGLPGERARA